MSAVTITIAGEELNVRFSYGAISKCNTFLKMPLQKWMTNTDNVLNVDMTAKIIEQGLMSGGNKKDLAWIYDNLDVTQMEEVIETIAIAVGGDKVRKSIEIEKARIAAEEAAAEEFPAKETVPEGDAAVDTAPDAPAPSPLA